VVVDGVLRGEVVVACTNRLTGADAIDFPPEEQTMLDTIAERIAGVLERRELANAAQRREEIYHAIVDQANDSVTVIDVTNGRFIEFNDAACRKLGPRRPPKVLHLWPPKLLHPAMGDLMH
jgi:PAS domain-containing protein